MPQLTITLDDKVWQAVREHAHQHGQELAKAAAELLQAAVQRPAPPEATPAPVGTRPLSPLVQELYGAVKLPADFDYKAAIEEAILEKYGRP